MNGTLNRETALEAEISQDVLDEIHFGGERHCSPDAPCDLATFHVTRLARISTGVATAAGTTHLDAVRVTDRVVPRPAAGTAARNQYGTFAVIPASDAQVRFLTRCLAERDLSSLPAIQTESVRMAREALTAGNLSKKLATSVLDYITQLPVKSDVPVRRASEKQVALITRLLAERDHGLEIADPAALTPKQASDTIDTLFAAPKRAVAPVADLEVGVYRKADGTMYRVYPARESKRVLAKRLVAEGDGWGFEYAGLASRFVSASERMSLEDAKAWGAQFGTCCVCAALLTDPESVARGIGPVCASRV